MKTSLCILTKNELPCLEVVLPDVINACKKYNIEYIYAIDGGSIDGTVEFFKKNNIKYQVHDPYLSDINQKKLISSMPNLKKFDLVIMCVGHRYYKKLNLKTFSNKPYYFDLNRVLEKNQINLMKKNNYKLEVLGG